MDFDVNNQLGAPDNGEENSSVEPNMTEETSEVRARGQESQQPQEEASLRSLLMDFMRTQSESLKVIKENLEENRREQNEKFDQQKEETNESFKIINEKFDRQKEEIKEEINQKFNKINENFNNHKEDVKRQMAEQLALIQAEMRDYKTSCDDKISEFLKKQEDATKELKDDTTKRFDEVWDCLLYTSRCV